MVPPTQLPLGSRASSRSSPATANSFSGAFASALGVAEPAGAHAVRIKVVDDVVVLPAVGHARRHVVELEVVAHLPGDVVIRAGGVTTHAQAADEGPLGVIQGHPAAEYVGPPDPLPYHEVRRRAVVRRVAAVGDVLVGGVRFLEPE